MPATAWNGTLVLGSGRVGGTTVLARQRLRQDRLEDAVVMRLAGATKAAISQELGVGHTTVDSYIAEARQRGLLPPTDPGGPGGSPATRARRQVVVMQPQPEPTPTDMRLLKISQVAEVLAVSPQTVRNYFKRGILHPVYLDRRTVRVRYDELERLTAGG